MAGTRETPEELAKRLESESVANPDLDPVVAAAPPPVYGRRAAPDENNAMVASAARVNLYDRRSIESMRARRQAWQTEAWDYVDEIGELGYTIGFAANLLSKVRLFAAVRPEAKAAPVPVEDFDESGVDQSLAKLAIETLERLRSSQGGQSALVKEITFNLEVAGELFLHGHEDPETREEDWQIRSVDELIVSGDKFALRSAPGVNQGEAIPQDDVVIRLWERHPRFSNLATCAMRRVLGEAESLLLLSREIRATAKSRLSNGLLLIPHELSFGSADPTRDPGDGEATDDPFDDELQESMILPIQSEGSASAIVPLTLRGPAEYLNAVRHIKLERPIDAALDARIVGRILRLARGLNMPVEVLTGLQETTFANAAQVKKSEWDAHGEPRAVLICDALTAGYFQPALEAAGVPRERVRDFFIWFDPTDAIAAPDPADNADKAHEDGIISDEARRRVQGFSESDAPSNDEILRRIVLNATRLDPYVLAQLFVITGLAPGIDIPAPASGIQTSKPDVQVEPDTESIINDAVIAAAASLPRGRKGLGTKLVEMDRDLRTRLRTSADAALKRALEKAGNRVRAKVQREKGDQKGSAARVVASVNDSRQLTAALGPSLVAALGFSDDDLIAHAFDDLEKDFDRWVAATQEAAVRIVSAATGRTVDDAAKEELHQRQARDRATAWTTLEANLINLAREKLYSSSAAMIAAGESDEGMDVSVSTIRESMAIAGGTASVDVDGTVSGVDGGPIGGVATGDVVLDLAGGVEGYEWDYGAAARSPFPPHEELDGVQFVNFDDDVLANNEGFPETDYFYPGDHDGCFVAGTVVSGPAARGSTLRRYEGELVELSFASGQKLTATPNHPILTDEGWVPAGALHEGSHVVRCVDAEGIAGLVPDDHQRPAMIEEVVRAVGESDGVLPSTVKVSPEHFHGDGRGSEVAVVRTDRQLRNRLDSPVEEPSGERGLVGPDPDTAGLSGDGGGAELLEGVGPAAFGLEGVGGDGSPAFGGPPRVDDEELVRDGADADPALDEPSRHRHAIDAETLGQRVDGIAGFVELDKVVDLRRREFAGDVYNLQTETGWYVANDVIVHNCTCDFVPVIINTDDAMTSDPDAEVGGPTITQLSEEQLAERLDSVQSELEQAQAAGWATEDQFDKLPTSEKWTEDRLDLHRQIVDDMMAQSSDIPRDREAIMSGGLPGAGKSTGLAEAVGIDPSKYFTIDPDAIKAELISRGAAPVLPGLSPMESASLIHEESSAVAKRLGEELQSRGTNVVWDITMNSQPSVQSRLDNLATSGYKNVQMYFFDISPETSVDRAAARYARGVDNYLSGDGLGGRYIDSKYLTNLKDPEYGSVNRRTFESVKGQASKWSLYDNSGTSPKLVAKSGR